MKMQNEQWFIAVLTAITGFFTFIAKSLWASRHRRRKVKRTFLMTHRLKLISKVYKSMGCIQDLEAVDMVFLVEVGNDGHIPKAGSEIFGRLISMEVDEEYGGDTTENFYYVNYSKFRVDDAYIDMVLECMETQNMFLYDAEKNHGDSFFKRITTEHNIKALGYWHVHSDTHKWKQYIIGIGSYKRGQKFKDLGVCAVLERNIEEIRLCFKESDI